jgi:hypothetical protein
MNRAFGKRRITFRSYIDLSFGSFFGLFAHRQGPLVEKIVTIVLFL